MSKKKKEVIKKYRDDSKEKITLIELINPMNLQKEVKRYGYTFNLKLYLIFVAATIGAIVFLSMLFRLKVVFSIVLFLSSAIVLPKFLLNMYQRMYQQKRLDEASDYSENMMYSFKKTGTILQSLRDTLEIYDETHIRMRVCLEKAIAYLEAGHSESGRLYEEALAIIEHEYNNSRIRMIHKFLVNVEMHGGEFDNSMNILLNEKSRWIKNTYALQREKQTMWRLTVVALIISIGLCYFVLASMKGIPTTINMMETIYVQVSSMMLIIADLLILLKTSSALTKDWLCDEQRYTDEYLRYAYNNVVNYDVKRQRKLSILFAIPFGIITCILIAFGQSIFSIIAAIVTMFIIFSYKIGYHANFNFVLDQVYLSISDWLIDMALLLQSNNVQVAISNSYANAPEILKTEILRLQERLVENPTDIKSYTRFCEKFDMPDVKSAMRMLYTLSEIGSGDAQEQMRTLIENNSEIISYAESLKYKNEIGKMKLIFSSPLLTGSAKMLVDLAVIMVVMLPSMAQTVS